MIHNSDFSLPYMRTIGGFQYSMRLRDLKEPRYVGDKGTVLSYGEVSLLEIGELSKDVGEVGMYKIEKFVWEGETFTFIEKEDRSKYK